MWTTQMRYKRFYIKFKNYLKTRHHLSAIQIKAIKIIKLILTKSEIEVLISPNSGKRYIHYKDVFVTINNEHVQIINHKYAYDVSLPRDVVEEIVKVFDRRTETERLKMEKEITTNINSSLTHLLDELGLNNK